MGISERMGDVLGQALEAKLLREVHEHPLKVNHLAIIMDGNRRFAWKSNLAAGIGHRIGKKNLSACWTGCWKSTFPGSPCTPSPPRT